MLLTQESEDVEPILTRLRTEVRRGQTLQGCCQYLMDTFQEALPDSIQLARTYATAPFRLLPEADRVYLQARGGAHLDEDTRVLSLLGTAGTKPEWRNRYQSQNHLAIPLVSEESISQMPMVANLILQLGSSANWYRRVGGGNVLKEDFGVFTDTFFVADAGSAVDSAGRLLIPDQKFVRDYGVRTVLGVGGQFSGEGIMVVSIFFTNEQLRGTPKWLLRVPLLLAAVAKPLVAQGKLYPP